MKQIVTVVFRALLGIITAGSNAIAQLRARFEAFAAGDRGQLGVFMVLVFGAVALVVVSITLLFGMSIAGEFTPSGSDFTAEENFSPDTSGTYEYTVERQPSDSDVLELNDDETVYNETSGAQLTEGSDYEWYPDNGTLRLFDSTTDTASTYNITYTGQEHTYAGASQSTTDSTGDAFELFGTSVLVIPASAVLAVLIGGMVGAISMRGSMPGFGSSNNRNRRRGR